MSERAIGIVGMGPVGTVLAAYLANSGVKVYGVDKISERVDQVNREGLLIEGYTQLRVRAAGCFTTLAELAEVQGIGAIFLCTKAWTIKPIMGDLTAHSWPDELRLIAFMNGIGPEDAVAAHFAPERVCRGVVNYAGSVGSDGVCTMSWFHPPNLLGPASDRELIWTRQMQEVMSGAGLGTREVSHHEIKKAAFYKNCMNAALNAIGATHGLTIGRAMKLRHTRGVIKGVLRECLTVGALLGYTFGEDTLDRFLTYLDAGGDHYPSMWFDLQAKRPTEIEFINGPIVRIGRMFRGAEVDLNLALMSAVISQEIHNGTRDAEDIPEYLYTD